MAAVVPIRDAVAASAPASLTLADLLGTSPLRGAKPQVLCGGDKLDAGIRWVHAGDASDVGTLLHGGEVLLTTGLGIGPKGADQRNFIDTAAERGVVGVILELGSAFHEAPEPLVAQASKRNLPLVVLHRPVRFVDVTEVAHQRILSDQLGALRRVEAMHRELMTLMLDGADAATMLEWLAQRVGIALSLVRPDDHVLFHAPAGVHSSTDMLEADARAALRGRPPMALPLPSPSGGAPVRLALPCHQGPLGTLDRAILTRACDLLALSLLRHRQEETLLARDRGDFLSGLIAGELSERESETRAAEFGWVESSFLLPVALAGRTRHQVHGQQDSWALIMQRAQQDLEAHGVPMLSGLIDGGHAVAAIVGVPVLHSRNSAPTGDLDARRSQIANRVAKAVRSEAARHLRAGGEVALCVGEPAWCWTDAGESLSEVVDLSPTSLSEPIGAWIDLGRPNIDLLVQKLLGNEVLERFAERRLGALATHDEARRSDLIRTLEAFFEHNCNKADTARALFLERQSLYSRLDRIEELLGESLADDNTRLGLQLALHVRRSRL